MCQNICKGDEFCYRGKSRLTRAGVIPFTIKRGKIYFLLGVDSKTKEYTDFGGGVKNHETFVSCACRELAEESCELFSGVITEDNLKNSFAIVNKNRTNVIFFPFINNSYLETAAVQFKIAHDKLSHIKKYNELVSIVWLNEDRFIDIAYNKRPNCMWQKVKNMFRQNIFWRQLRCTLLGCNQRSTLNLIQNTFNLVSVF